MGKNHNKLVFNASDDVIFKLDYLCSNGHYTRAELLRKITEDYVHARIDTSGIYLEISGRQTGKTTRLIDEAIYHASHNNGASVIFAVNVSAAKNIKSMVDSRIDDLIGKVYYDVESIKNNILIITSNVKCQLSSRFSMMKVRYFYDEFDFLDFSKNGIPIMMDGYYCTTPKFLRKSTDNPDDLLLNLVKFTGHKYVSRIYTRNVSMFESLSKEQIQMEVYGKYLSFE